MKKRKIMERINDKKTIKINIAMSILLLVVLSFISLGYALYGQQVRLAGSSTFGTQGIIAITDVTLTSSKNVRSDSIPEFTADAVDFNLTFEKEAGSTEPDYQAVYSITIDNDTFYDYDFNLANFQPVITNSSGINVDPSYLSYTLSGINLGDSIPAGETVTFSLTMDFNPPVDDTYSVDGNMGTQLEEQPHGSVIGAIPNNATADLRESENNDLAPIVVSVINSYQSPRTFTLGISDSSHFELADSNGNSLSSFTIQGGDTQDYTIYIKRVDNAVFSQEYFITNITLSYADVVNSDCGNITIRVDEQVVHDTTPPEISGLTVTINDATSEDTSNLAVGSITLNWSGAEPETAVKKYYIVIYKDGTQLGDVRNTADLNPSNPLTPQATFTGLGDGSYSFKVYGENTQDIMPDSSQISSCNSSYCATTSSTSYSWHFTISLTSDSTNVDSISPTAVNRGKNVSVTITPGTYTSGTCGTTTNYYTLSENPEVRMNGTIMSTGNAAGQYQYNRTTTGNKTATLNLYGVTGNVTVKVTGSQ